MDILAGGLLPHSNASDRITSISYYDNDLTWCVQKSSVLPMIFQFFMVLDKEVWFVLMFGYGIGSVLVLFVMIPFDMKYKRRNQTDFHYLSSIPLRTFFGWNPRFTPMSCSIRLFYGMMLFTGFGMLIGIQVKIFKYVQFPLM